MTGLTERRGQRRLSRDGYVGDGAIGDETLDGDVVAERPVGPPAQILLDDKLMLDRAPGSVEHGAEQLGTTAGSGDVVGVTTALAPARLHDRGQSDGLERLLQVIGTTERKRAACVDTRLSQRLPLQILIGQQG